MSDASDTGDAGKSEKEGSGEEDPTKRGRGKLSLSKRSVPMKRTVSSGNINQSFSRGRTKTVMVERKVQRRRPTGAKAKDAPVDKQAAAEAPREAAKRQKPAADAAPRTPRPPRRDEQSAPKSTPASAAPRSRAPGRKPPHETPPRRSAGPESRERDRQPGPSASPAQDSRDRLAAEEETRRVLEAEQAHRRESGTVTEPEDSEPRPPKRGRGRPPAARRSEPRRRGGKMTIANALNDEDRQRSLAAVRRQRERERRQMAQGQGGQGDGYPAKVSREVVLPEAITIQELANRMAERAADVVRALMSHGVMARMNTSIDADTAQLIAEEMGHTVKRVAESDVEDVLVAAADKPGDMKPRAPVVAVMGHVDHGKTSLLDALRRTTVAAGEAGGITQHIGAYQVATPGGQKVTFLDTPGHAAFTAMRARGAQVTDVVILVVAADDGVMPQTVEAINHARAAGTAMVVAVNKMDRPGADSAKVSQDLLSHEVMVESMSGDVQLVEVSAATGQGLDKLLEAVLLQAELLELKANPDCPAEGTVVEARLDRGRGQVATVLVTRGTLRAGDAFVVGSEWGRVRLLMDENGGKVEQAGPSVPVEILGVNGTPMAGDHLVVLDSESRARDIADYRQRIRREHSVGQAQRGTLESMIADAKDVTAETLSVIVKADAHGSAEALVQALEKMTAGEMSVRITHSGVGGITESDVTLASTVSAPILAFNVRAGAQARVAAKKADVDIRHHTVIYELLDEVKATMNGMRKPDIREIILGEAQILEVFKVSNVGRVAGCRVGDGQLARTGRLRLIRDDVTVHEGAVASLRRFKDEVRTVAAGQECGVAFENYQDFKQGDRIECFQVEETRPVAP